MAATRARKHRNRQTPVSSNARLEMRVAPEQKAFFTRAAALRGLTLTDFAIDTLQAASVKTVEEYNLLRLSVEDQQVFVNALMNPPAPTDALNKAAERYARMVRR
jgi:uncharacterized protein (DUF1778 family)